MMFRKSVYLFSPLMDLKIDRSTEDFLLRLYYPYDGVGLKRRPKYHGLTKTWQCSCTYSKIIEQLRQHPGGSVDLLKDNNTGIATITINNPEKKNAISGKMMVDLEECVSELENWVDGKGLILTGKDKTFCSGGDLGTVRNILSNGDDMCKFMHHVTTRLYNLPLISVALVDGYALGGGAELITACDFRLITPRAKIGFIHVKLNIGTGFGGTTRLVQQIGRIKTLQVLSSGMVMNTDLAKKIGLVDEILDNNENTLEQGKTWLLEHCKGSVTTTRVIKQMVLAGEKLDTDASLLEERKLFKSVWGNKLHAAAVSKKSKHS
ncbi:enoyl CoA hydratase domain-containing protein 1 [Mactra antiquata]